MSIKDNIVKFPQSKIVREQPQSIEVIEKAREKGLLSFVDMIVDNIVVDIDDHITANGLNMEEPANVKDFLLVTYTIKSMILRSVGLKHPIQDDADKIVIVPDD